MNRYFFSFFLQYLVSYSAHVLFFNSTEHVTNWNLKILLITTARKKKHIKLSQIILQHVEMNFCIYSNIISNFDFNINCYYIILGTNYLITFSANILKTLTSNEIKTYFIFEMCARLRSVWESTASHRLITLMQNVSWPRRWSWQCTACATSVAATSMIMGIISLRWTHRHPLPTAYRKYPLFFYSPYHLQEKLIAASNFFFHKASTKSQSICVRSVNSINK